MSLNPSQLTQRMDLHMKLEDGSIFQYVVKYGETTVGHRISRRDGKDRSDIITIDGQDFITHKDNLPKICEAVEKFLCKEGTK